MCAHQSSEAWTTTVIHPKCYNEFHWKLGYNYRVYRRFERRESLFVIFIDSFMKPSLKCV